MKRRSENQELSKGSLSAEARPTKALVTAIGLALGITFTTGALAQTATSQEVQALKSQMEQLQRQLDDVQRRQAQQQAATAPAPAATPAPAAAPAKGPGIQAGPLTITFGGFTELAGIYRNRNEAADIASNWNTGIPFPNAAAEHMSEFRMSARQSRLSILTQGPQDGDATAEAYFEMDFLGAAPTANSVESNSYNLRMRHIYGTYYRKDWGFYLLAGQNWSLVTLEKTGMRPRNELTPLVIDAQYVPGFTWTRNPQVRFVKEFDKKLALGLSFESPQTIFAGTVPAGTLNTLPGGSGYFSGNNYSLDFVPDVVLKVAADPGYGHYELFGLGRGFRNRVGSSNETTYGGGIGAGIVLPLVPNMLDFQLSGLAGDGIGRYGSAQLPDVTMKPDGKLATVSEYDVLAGLIFKPTTTWTIYAYAGREHASSKTYVSGTTGYGYGSPLYNNTACMVSGNATSTSTPSTGTNCAANTKSVDQVALGAWWKYYQGVLGNLQFGLQGSYTKRTTFTGVGGAPDANMTVGMVSFRYYPYQK